MVASPDLCSRAWVTDQYDRYVLGNTVLAQPEDAGVVRIDEATGLGVALATDGNGRYTRLDPYAGAQLALAEAYRNVAATGAEPIAVTNCLNFGSPEDPGVMWQFAEAVRGLADGCRAARHPGDRRQRQLLQPDRRRRRSCRPRWSACSACSTTSARRTPMGFRRPGDVVVLLGETGDGLRRLGVGVRGARAPRRHPAAGRPGGGAGAGARCWSAAPGCSAARTTCPTAAWPRRWSSRRCARASAPGSRVDGDPFVAALQRVDRPGAGHGGRATTSTGWPALAAEHGVPLTRLGEVTADATLTVDGVLAVPLAELREAHESTLPRLFDCALTVAARRVGRRAESATRCWPRPT